MAKYLYISSKIENTWKASPPLGIFSKFRF